MSIANCQIDYKSLKVIFRNYEIERVQIPKNNSKNMFHARTFYNFF